MKHDYCLWLRTPEAAHVLSCSTAHLKRCRDIKGGFLIGGVDYMNGCSRSSAITWNIPNIREKFHKRVLAANNNAALINPESKKWYTL